VALRLYNTLTRQKEDFAPLDPANVRMYVCGPTVYDFAHIGNARPAIVFDVLFRLLRHEFAADHVKYVRNITDVDDKINKRAAEDFPDLPLNEAIRKVTELTEAQYHEDIDALGCLRPTVEPRATEHIAEMKALIETLIEKGHAYVAEEHVLFDVPSMPEYGKLARRSLDEMEAGARVDVAPYKRDAMDFVLWKPSKPGEPAWDSPAGIETPGRPGWHIECSAMAWKHLGETFDIHGGGIDLVFPHHENEVAQTCCAFHSERMAQVWMHNGFLQVEGEKMSKSLGNFITIRELLDTENFGGRKWTGEVLRLAMLMTHYRDPINWTQRLLEESEAKYLHWIELTKRHHLQHFDIRPTEDFVRKLNNDLDTHGAISVLDKLASSGEENDKLKLYMNLVFLGLIRREFVGVVQESEYNDDDQYPEGGIVEEPVGSKNIRVFFSAPKKTEVILHIGNPLYCLSDSANTTAATNIISNIYNQEKISKPFWLLEEEEWVKYQSGNIRKEDLERLKIIINAETINRLIEDRKAARGAKNWGEADRIRDELAAKGIALKDNKDPETGELVTTWEIAR
jgi:cysteinyl-tRNA synthetase